MKQRSLIRDVASPLEGVLTARTIRAEHIDRVVQLRGVIPRMHASAIDGEKCFRLQKEPAFTPAGSTPRSNAVIAEPDAQVFMSQEPFVIEGEVGLLPGKPLNVSQRVLKLPRTGTVALTMIIRFQRVIKPGQDQRVNKRRNHVEEQMGSPRALTWAGGVADPATICGDWRVWMLRRRAIREGAKRLVAVRSARVVRQAPGFPVAM
jgi:hypothetical protein